MFDARTELLTGYTPDQQRKTNLGWISLYSWEDEMKKGQANELALRYSRYKYGDFSAVSQFSKELAILIDQLKGNEIKDNPGDWVVFTPPYSFLEPTSRVLGDNLARAFNIPHIDFRAIQAGNRKVLNPSIKDPHIRLQTGLAVQTTIPDSPSVEGRRGLVIDDMMTTGITAAYMEKVLLERYDLGYVFGFCLINLATKDSGYEETINELLVSSGDLGTLISILNDPRTQINRYTLNSLYGEDKGVLDSIASRLSPLVVKKLEEARDKYYLSSST